MKHPEWCTCTVCIPDPAERAAEVLRQEIGEMDATFSGTASRSGNVVTTTVGGKRITIRVEG